MNPGVQPINYHPSPPANPPARARLALIFLAVQAVWYVPAVFATFWAETLLTPTGLHPATHLAGAAAVVAPSLVAILLAAPVLLRRRRHETDQVVMALLAALVALAFVVYVFAASIHFLKHPTYL